MKKYLLFSLILIFGASTLLAQDGKKIEYKTYKVEQDGFSLEVPKNFDLRSADEKEDEYRSYDYRSPELYLFIDSRQPTYKSFNKEIIEYATSNKAIVRHLALKDFDADKYQFLDKDGFFQTIIIIPGRKRNLIFHSVSTNINDPSVNRFFSSIKFDNLKIPEILALGFFNAQTETEKIPVPINEPEDKSDKKTGNVEHKQSGRGIGLGDGSGKAVDKAKDNGTTGLKLLSKPKPAYTDLARQYNVQGNVLLRVTFLADGKIGSISAVEKLPFGLTYNAIEAAKLMKFEPPKRNGVSYNVTKTVQFSFTIY